MTSLVNVADGRRVAVDESGSPDGRPVFLMHGTPGSRLGPLPRATVLHKLGVRLVTCDRPGYGRSDRLPSRLVADVAADVERVADTLGIDQFAVLGRSGGGPHALACAALLPDRVTRAAVLVSLAPRAAKGLDWFANMAPSNVHEYTVAATDPVGLTADLVRAAGAIRANPASHVATLGPELPESDRRVVSDASLRAKLADNFAEALRDSADGWIDDALALISPWGFDPAEIKVPVLLWAGESDVFSPVAHTRWLAGQIPQALMSIQPDSAHFGALTVMPSVLSWLTRADR